MINHRLDIKKEMSQYKTFPLAPDFYQSQLYSWLRANAEFEKPDPKEVLLQISSFSESRWTLPAMLSKIGVCLLQTIRVAFKV